LEGFEDYTHKGLMHLSETNLQFHQSFSCIFILNMSNILRFDFKKECSKWLFAVIIFLSFFTFPGIVIQSYREPYAQQTTLVANRQTRFIKSISYKQALRQTYRSYPANAFFTNATFDISRLHTRQIQTRVDSLSLSYKCRPRTVFALLLKRIPQNAGDYPAIFLG
jgi:hypothetical protein